MINFFSLRIRPDFTARSFFSISSLSSAPSVVNFRFALKPQSRHGRSLCSVISIFIASAFQPAHLQGFHSTWYENMMAGDQIAMQTWRYMTGIFKKDCHESSNHFPGMISTYFIISSYLNTYVYFVATFVILSEMVCWCFFFRYQLSTMIDLQCPHSQALSAFSQLPTSPLVDWGNDFRWSWGMPCLPSFFRQGKADATQDIDVDV